MSDIEDNGTGVQPSTTNPTCGTLQATAARPHAAAAAAAAGGGGEGEGDGEGGGGEGGVSSSPGKGGSLHDMLVGCTNDFVDDLLMFC